MDAIKTAKVWIGERKGITSPIHVSQYDTAWTFQFKVYKDDLIYEPENAVSVVFTGKKSDDTVFAVPAEFEDGVATVVSTVAMTSAAGIVECELRFSEGGETVGTANFDMVVEASPVEGGTPSESDFTTLQNIPPPAVVFTVGKQNHHLALDFVRLRLLVVVLGESFLHGVQTSGGQGDGVADGGAVLRLRVS